MYDCSISSMQSLTHTYAHTAHTVNKILHSLCYVQIHIFFLVSGASASSSLCPVLPYTAQTKCQEHDIDLHVYIHKGVLK